MDLFHGFFFLRGAFRFLISFGKFCAVEHPKRFVEGRGGGKDEKGFAPASAFAGGTLERCSSSNPYPLLSMNLSSNHGRNFIHQHIIFL